MRLQERSGETAVAGYLSKLSKDVARWQAEGLIDEATAAALLRDVQSRPGGVRFGSVLAILAAVLVGAALLLLIAANWEAFPRLLRVALIVAGILAGYLGGAYLKNRGHDHFGEALWLLAAVTFGAGIGLVGQMYHLSGDETQAILVWCAGPALAAIALRSHPLTVGAVLLAGGWLLMVATESGRGDHVPPSYLALAAVLWAVSLWTASTAARHLILLSLMLYVVLVYLDSEGLVAPILLAAVSAAAFAWGAAQPQQSERIVKLGGGLPVQGLLGFIAGMSIVQFEYYEERSFLLVAIIVFAGVVAALVLAGRESRMLRWLAYAAFIYELGFVYVTLIGTMLGTAGLFLAAGLVLAAIAIVITRIERRVAGSAAGEGRA